MHRGVSIQVRLGSTRLQGKALLPLCGLAIIQHVMRCLSRVPADVRALVTERQARRPSGPSPTKKDSPFLWVLRRMSFTAAHRCPGARCRRGDTATGQLR